MDPVIGELLKGPPTDDPLEQVAWLYKVQESLANSHDKGTADIAVPLKEAADLISANKDKSEEEQQAVEPQVAALMLQAQALAVFAFVKQLSVVRDAFAEEAKKQKPGSENRRKAEVITQTYADTVEALTRAYNGALAGNAEALESLDGEFERIAALSAEQPK